MEVCSQVLDELVCSLPLGGLESLDSVSDEDSSVSLTGQLVESDSSLADQTLTMDRETDKAARIQVLLRLIKLAGMMVSIAS